MDGIFGVGLSEMLIIALALFIIGGPKNTAKWARELGVWVRKARQAWSQVIAEMETELGPEGKEVLDVARELGKGVNEMRGMNPTRRAMNETVRMVTDMTSLEDEKPKVPAIAASSVPSAPAKSEGVDTPTQAESSAQIDMPTPEEAPAPAVATPSVQQSVKTTAKTTDSKYPAWVPRNDHK